jgi:hypothetical protein
MWGWACQGREGQGRASQTHPGQGRARHRLARHRFARHRLARHRLARQRCARDGRPLRAAGTLSLAPPRCRSACRDGHVSPCHGYLPLNAGALAGLPVHRIVRDSQPIPPRASAIRWWPPGHPQESKPHHRGTDSRKERRVARNSSTLSPLVLLWRTLLADDRVRPAARTLPSRKHSQSQLSFDPRCPPSRTSCSATCSARSRSACC